MIYACRVLPASLVTTFLFVTSASARVDRAAIVHVEAECRHPTSGAIVRPLGSGVIFNKAGYILTAAHVVACRIENIQYDRKTVRVRRGDHRASQVDVDIRGVASDQDVAVLKIAALPAEYPFLTACRKAPLAEETPFIGYGFPEGQEYVPVSGLVGAETSDGNYSAVANFVGGMSGGPIVIDNYVVALIQGGAGEVVARRAIIPLFRAGSVIQDALGQPFPFCDEINGFSARIDLLLKETQTKTRLRKSPTQGVSTGSLVETKCQNFTIPATNGWKILKDTVTIVDKISQGSATAEIIGVTEDSVVVRFCARSTMHTITEKHTGDSFGAVQFTEAREELVEVPKTVEAKAVDGKIDIQLPKNTVKWTGQLFSINSDAAVAFTKPGMLEGFSIDALGGNSGLVIRKAGNK